MSFEIDLNHVLEIVTLLSVALAYLKYAFSVHDWAKTRDETEARIRAEVRSQNDKIAEIKEEQALLVYGTLACLKGLKEKGCNGPVTDAIIEIEKYINQIAHDA